MIIYLGDTSPYPSSDLPEGSAGHLITPQLGLASGGGYQAGLLPDRR